MQALKQLDKNAQRAIRIPNNNIINQTKNGNDQLITENLIFLEFKWDFIEFIVN